MLNNKVVLNKGNGETVELNLNLTSVNGMDVKEVSFKKLDLGVLYSLETVDYNTNKQFMRMVVNADLVVSIETL